jgi:hypothetical protein
MNKLYEKLQTIGSIIVVTVVIFLYCLLLYVVGCDLADGKAPNLCLTFALILPGLAIFIFLDSWFFGNKNSSS